MKVPLQKEGTKIQDLIVTSDQSYLILSQVLYHRLSTVAHTIDCVYSKILNHDLNHGLLFSHFG